MYRQTFRQKINRLALPLFPLETLAIDRFSFNAHHDDIIIVAYLMDRYYHFHAVMS